MSREEKQSTEKQRTEGMRKMKYYSVINEMCIDRHVMMMGRMTVCDQALIQYCVYYYEENDEGNDGNGRRK